ncbi:hypothetical protein LINGRAPRIM_LOCUS1264 [Linum grandiflorum]
MGGWLLSPIFITKRSEL